MIKLIKYSLIFATILPIFCGNASAQTVELPSPDYSCSLHTNIQEMRSAELQELVRADQKDRENWNNMSEKEMTILTRKDLVRRKRVGEIFGEGCFKSSADYAAAALIYQHGNMPDHYYLAFTWANRAYSLGDTNQKGLIAITIDRYLVAIGKKQLFGSQAYTDEKSHGCYCLQPVEQTFPDSQRKDYSGLSLSDRHNWLHSLNAGKACPKTECSLPLGPSPSGTIPGFW